MTATIYHTEKHLSSMREKIATLTLSEMEKYADKICKELVQDGAEFKHLIEEAKSNDIDFEDYDATSIGNLAYIACHHKKGIIKVAAIEIINKYKKYLKNEK